MGGWTSSELMTSLSYTSMQEQYQRYDFQNEFFPQIQQAMDVSDS